MRDKAPPTLLQGQAGVWRVASELALRGFNPHFPGVDYGYDLVVDGGIRIQVKSTHWTTGKMTPYGSYVFHLRRSAVARGNKRITPCAVRVFSAKSEFVVLYGIEQGRFWIVPAAALDGVSLVVVGMDVRYRAVNTNDIKALHAQGSTQKEIAEMLGVGTSTIARRLNGQYTTPFYTKSAEVRALEGRWDLIEDYLSTLTEAEDSIFPVAEPAGVRED